MKIYATTGSYVLGRMLGAREAARVISHIAAHGVAPRELAEADVPGARTIFQLAKAFDGVSLRVDGNSVAIGKARSRAMHAALESDADVWVTVDDDVAADAETLRWLVAAVTRDEQARVCMAPYLQRNAVGVASVVWSPVYMEDALPDGGRVRRALRGGFGLVAMNRLAMLIASQAAPLFRDDDGEMKAATFLEHIHDGKWLGEDFAFFARLPTLVHVEGLVTGRTAHNGVELELEKANL